MSNKKRRTDLKAAFTTLSKALDIYIQASNKVIKELDKTIAHLDDANAKAETKNPPKSTGGEQRKPRKPDSQMN